MFEHIHEYNGVELPAGGRSLKLALNNLDVVTTTELGTQGLGATLGRIAGHDPARTASHAVRVPCPAPISQMSPRRYGST